MQIEFLLLSDHAEVLNNKLYTMGAGWNMVTLPLPHPWSFAISLGINVPWDETNQRHSLILHTEDPDGNILGDRLEGEFEVGRPPGARPGQEQRITLSVQAHILFETSGPHAVIATINGEPLHRARFYLLPQ